MDSLSILLMGVVLILQEIQIIRIQSKVNYHDRKLKNIVKGMIVQGEINKLQNDFNIEVDNFIRQ